MSGANDEAISFIKSYLLSIEWDCFASLAMTGGILNEIAPSVLLPRNDGISDGILEFIIKAALRLWWEFC